MKQLVNAPLPSASRTFTNVGVAWLYKLLSTVAALVLTGLATRYFGLEAVGAWILATSLATYFVLLDLGLSSSLPRILPRMFVARDHQGASRVVSTGVTFALFAGIVLIASAPLIAWLASKYQPVHDDLRWLVGALTGVAIVSAAIALPLRAGFGLLGSVHRFDVYFWIEISILLVKTLLVLIALLIFELGLIAYAVIMSVMPLVAAAAQFRIGLKLCGISGPLIGPLARPAFRELLSLSGASLLMTFAAALSLQGSSMIAGYALSVETAAVLSLPMIVVVSAMAFSGPFGALLSPMASTLHGAGDKERMRHVVITAVRASSALAALTAIVLFLAGPLFLQYWLQGPKVNAAAVNLMADVVGILAFGIAALVPGSTAKGMLAGTGRHWQAAKADLVGSLMTVLLGLILLLVFQLGVIALCWAMVVGFVARGLFGLPLLTAQALELTYLAYVRKALLAPLSIGLVVGATTIVLREDLGGAYDIWAVILATGVATLLWVAGTWLFVLAPAHKRRVLSFARGCIA